MPPLNVDHTLNTKVNTPEVKKFHVDLKTVMTDLLFTAHLPNNTRILLTCRLNRTGVNVPPPGNPLPNVPIWCGWLENVPGGGSPQLDHLLGGAHASPIYRAACITGDDHVHVVPSPEHPVKPQGSLGHDVNLNYDWRAYMCVKDNAGKKIGTLTVGLPGNTPNGAKNLVIGRLPHWAQGPGGFETMVSTAYLPSRF